MSSCGVRAPSQVASELDRAVAGRHWLRPCFPVRTTVSLSRAHQTIRREERKDAADLVRHSGVGDQGPQLRRDDLPGLLRRAGDGCLACRREKLDPNIVYELATWLFLGGVVGARGLYVIFHPETIRSAGDIFRSWQGGNVFYGCILGGLTGSLIYWYRRPFPFWLMADAVAPAVAIGAAIGRIGCFLNGCCDGAVCSHPVGGSLPGRFPRLGSPAQRRLDFTGNAGIAAGASHPALRVARRVRRARPAPGSFPPSRHPGEVMALLMILYSLTRWPIEALRADERAVFAGMTLVAEYQRRPRGLRAGDLVPSQGVALLLRRRRTEPASGSSPPCEGRRARAPAMPPLTIPRQRISSSLSPGVPQPTSADQWRHLRDPKGGSPVTQKGRGSLVKLTTLCELANRMALSSRAGVSSTTVYRPAKCFRKR